MSSCWWEYHTYYLSDTRDLGNNNDHATYVLNFNFAINNFLYYLYVIMCMCLCINLLRAYCVHLCVLNLLTIEHMPV